MPVPAFRDRTKCGCFVQALRQAQSFWTAPRQKQFRDLRFAGTNPIMRLFTAEATVLALAVLVAGMPGHACAQERAERIRFGPLGVKPIFPYQRHTR